MNQVRMFHGIIEDMLNNPKKSFLHDEGYSYLRLEWKSFLHRRFSPNYAIEISVDLNPLIIYFTIPPKDVCLVNATGVTSYGKRSYDEAPVPDPVNPDPVYRESRRGRGCNFKKLYYLPNMNTDGNNQTKD